VKRLLDAREQHGVSRRRPLHDQMRGEDRLRRAHAPDVEIVHIEYTIDSNHCFCHLVQFQPSRKAFQQNVQRLANNVPGRIDDKDTENNGKYRIDKHPPGEVNRHSADNNGHSTNGIACHMNHCCPNV